MTNDLVTRLVAENIEAWGWGPLSEIEGLAEHQLAIDACRAGYVAAIEQHTGLVAENERALKAEILRLVDALTYAHSEGFEWPVDPLPFGSIAHNLFIERGNDPERIEARSALSSVAGGGGQ